MSIETPAPQSVPQTSEPRSDSQTPAPKPQLSQLSHLLGAWEAEATAAHRAYTSGQPRGPISGFKLLDKEMGGCFLPGLHFVHGQPGTGKTAFGLQMAATCRTPAIFLSCEMAPLELLRRHTARVTETYLGRLKSGEMPPAQSMALARRAAAAAPQMAFIDATTASASPAFIRDCADIVRGDSPHLLIVIDSLQSWVEGVAGSVSEYEALGEGIARLRQLAHELQAPFFLMCERNRESMKSGGLSAGAGTRKIEYSAETVIDLGGDETTATAATTTTDVQGEKLVRLRLTKNRHGTVGRTLELKFNGGFQRFKEG
jgi:replicative DNA helicase